jgi:hypothetical protein
MGMSTMTGWAMKHLVRITNTHRAGKPVVIGTDGWLPTLIFIDSGQTKIVTVEDGWKPDLRNDHGGCRRWWQRPCRGVLTAVVMQR